MVPTQPPRIPLEQTSNYIKGISVSSVLALNSWAPYLLLHSEFCYVSKITNGLYPSHGHDFPSLPFIHLFFPGFLIVVPPSAFTLPHGKSPHLADSERYQTSAMTWHATKRGFETQLCAPSLISLVAYSRPIHKLVIYERLGSVTCLWRKWHSSQWKEQGSGEDWCQKWTVHGFPCYNMDLAHRRCSVNMCWIKSRDPRQKE